MLVNDKDREEEVDHPSSSKDSSTKKTLLSLFCFIGGNGLFPIPKGITYVRMASQSSQKLKH